MNIEMDCVTRYPKCLLVVLVESQIKVGRPNPLAHSCEGGS